MKSCLECQKQQTLVKKVSFLQNRHLILEISTNLHLQIQDKKNTLIARVKLLKIKKNRNLFVNHWVQLSLINYLQIKTFDNPRNVLGLGNCIRFKIPYYAPESIQYYF